MRVVVCAALLYPDGTLVVGARHFDIAMREQVIRQKRLGNTEAPLQGFIDQHGVFMLRREALAVATAAEQINTRRPKTEPKDILFSEDLY